MRLWHRVLRLMAYILYALVAFVVFLYLTFPYDVLRQRLVDLLSQEGVRLSIERLQPAFPPGLQARGLRLLVEPWSETEAALQLEAVRLQPEWIALLSGTLHVHIEAALYGGRLEGELRHLNSEGGESWDVKTRFTDLDTTEHPLVRKTEKPFLRGRLSGEITAVLTEDGHLQESTVLLRGQPLALLGLPGSVFQLQREIVCDTLQGELKTPPKQAGNVGLTCQGKDLLLEAKGTIAWKAPMAESQLNVRWQVRSEEAYKQEMDLLAVLVRKRPDRRGELSFRLQGPLRQLRLGA
ncbi:MAG: type II secretion system protein GspN [Candidatus Tectimicrobiota bacterium]